MALTEEQVKQIIAEDSAATKAAKAAEILARRRAEENAAVRDFLLRHSGTQGVANNRVYWDCAANRIAMEGYLRKNGLSLSNVAHLEEAYNACRADGSLAEEPSGLPHIPTVETVQVSQELKDQRPGEVIPDELANKSTPNYVRRKDREPHRDSLGEISPVHPSSTVIPPAPVHLDLTKKEIIAMASTGELRRQIKLFGKEYEKEVNRILAGRPAVQ